MAYDPLPATASNKSRAKTLRGKSKAAFQVQSSMCQLWQRQAEIFYGERANFFMERSVGVDYYEGIYTSRPSILRRNMGNKLGAMIRPRAKDWFKLSASTEALKDDEEVKRWCEWATRTQRNIIYDKSANFTSAMAESDQDYVTFGNSVVAHTYNKRYDGVLFKCLHLRDCAWFVDEDGVVRELYRKMREPLDVLARMFGKENLPKKWQDRIKDDKGHEQEVVLCASAPADRYDLGTNNPRDGQAFITVYLTQDDMDDGDGLIAEGFHRAFPYTVRRWMTVSGEDYGRSPCTSVALADGRVLNRVAVALLDGVELKVRPPMTVRDEAVGGTLAIRPGGVTVVDDEYDNRNGPVVDTIDIGDPRYAMEFKADLVEDLADAFFDSVFNYLPDKEMTAYEVGKHLDQYIQQAAPIFEPMEAENASIMEAVFVMGMYKDAFGRMLPDGSIEDLPEQMSEAKTEFEFETPLHQAIRERKISHADEVMARVNGLLQTQHPKAAAAVDNVNFDKMARDVVEGVDGLDWLEDEEAVQQQRIDRAEQEAEAQNQEAAMAAADMALKANPENLSKAQQMIEGA